MDTMSKLLREDGQRSYMFRIAPELRNRIFHDCLLTERTIIVDATGHEQPALLRTCRQIREEALKIFEANTFCLPIIALGYPAPRSHWIHNAGIRKFGTVFTKSTGRDIWENLIDWLRRYYEGTSHRWNCNEPLDTQVLIEHAFDIVDTMKSGKKDWEVVQNVLEIWRKTVNGEEARTLIRSHSHSGPARERNQLEVAIVDI
jgi:hypothetical protein